MSSFTKATPLLLKKGSTDYFVDEPFDYYTNLFGVYMTIRVPKGFYSDLMSGPEKLKEDRGIYREWCAAASILHDRLYYHPVAYRMQLCEWVPVRLTRKQCDRLYKEALTVLVPLFESSINEREVIHDIYKILRNWGWFAWYKHRLSEFLFGIPDPGERP